MSLIGAFFGPIGPLRPRGPSLRLLGETANKRQTVNKGKATSSIRVPADEEMHHSVICRSSGHSSSKRQQQAGGKRNRGLLGYGVLLSECTVCQVCIQVPIIL